MGKVFFSSDFHYHHKNIVKGISSWDDKGECRNFETLEQHDATLVANINKVCKSEDTLYFLGDWSFGGPEEITKFRKQLNVGTIHFITGNHDKDLIMRPSLWKGPNPGFDSISAYKEIKIADQLICMFHYPTRVWNKANRGSWFLHGHCHGTSEIYAPMKKVIKGLGYYKKDYPAFKTMDVGIDTHPNFQPWSFDSIKEIMDKRRVIGGVDHHKSRM